MKKIKKYLFEATFFVVALILFGYAILKEPPVSSQGGDFLGLTACMAAIGLVLIAFFGRRTFNFFSPKRNFLIETEDLTIDAFRNEDEWKEFVSDGSH
jgi:hypothetical protein